MILTLMSLKYLSSTNVDKEASWIKQYWRPAVAWQYLAVCLFDFMIAPIMLMVFAYLTKSSYIAWTPLTLQMNGFYHLSMGAIVGVSSWSRGQEKITKLSVSGDQTTIETEAVAQTPVKTK